MYNNRVRYILKDKIGNTVGAEVDFNGSILKLSTAELKLKQPQFINATVDKNGHVRAKSGNLPKKEHISAPILNIVETNIDNGVRLEVGKCQLRYAILIEDEKAGFILYTSLIRYLVESNKAKYKGIRFDIITTHGKSSVCTQLSKLGEYSGYIVVVDRLGEYRKERNDVSIISDIIDELGPMGRSGLFAPLSTEYCIATLKFLYTDLCNKNCATTVPKWFLDYLKEVQLIFNSGGRYITTKVVGSNKIRHYLNGRYNNYATINGELPNLEKQVTRILWNGSRNTHFAYEKKMLSKCLLKNCCFSNFIQLPTDNRCGKTGKGLEKMELWERHSCLKIFISIFNYVVFGDKYTKYTKSDIVNEVF